MRAIFSSIFVSWRWPMNHWSIYLSIYLSIFSLSQMIMTIYENSATNWHNLLNCVWYFAFCSSLCSSNQIPPPSPFQLLGKARTTRPNVLALSVRPLSVSHQLSPQTASALSIRTSRSMYAFTKLHMKKIARSVWPCFDFRPEQPRWPISVPWILRRVEHGATIPQLILLQFCGACFEYRAVNWLYWLRFCGIFQYFHATGYGSFLTVRTHTHLFISLRFNILKIRADVIIPAECRALKNCGFDIILTS
jgi:hypothetical protein